MNLVDEFFLEASPNPDRVGCPPEEVMVALAQHKLAADHPARKHLATCSECFAEYRAFKLEANAAKSSATTNHSWNTRVEGAPGLQTSENTRSSTVSKPTGPPPAPAPAFPLRQEPEMSNLDHGFFRRKGSVEPTKRFCSRVVDLSSHADLPQALPIGLVDLELHLEPSLAEGPYRLLFSQGLGDFSAEFATAGVLQAVGERKVLRVFADFSRFSKGSATLTLVAALPETSEAYFFAMEEQN